MAKIGQDGQEMDFKRRKIVQHDRFRKKRNFLVTPSGRARGPSGICKFAEFAGFGQDLVVGPTQLHPFGGRRIQLPFGPAPPPCLVLS